MRFFFFFFFLKPLVWRRRQGGGVKFFSLFFFFLLDKSRNLFKFVSVLLSASVERVGVSRMRDFKVTNRFLFLLAQFHFKNIIPICKYTNLTNIIPIHKYFSKYSWISYSYLLPNIYKEYEYISLWLCLLGKFFKWKIYKSQEKEIFRHFFEKNRYQVFMNYLRILPIWQILFLFLFASFGIHKLFLFLFVQNLAPQIYPIPIRRKNYYSLITDSMLGGVLQPGWMVF